MRWGSVLFIAALCAAQTGLGASSKPAPLQSEWRTVEVVIDGSSHEWAEFAPFAEKVPLSIGLKNDDEFLYVAFSISDPGVRRMLARTGLIVWFDGEGGNKKRFGIRYPLIESFEGQPMRGRGGSGGYGGGSGGGQPPPPGAGGDPNQQGGESRPRPPAIDFDPAKDGRWAHFEVIGPAKDDVRNLMLDKAPGIALRIGDEDGSIMYEMKIPLQVNDAHPYAIGAAAGATIGIGLETPEIKSEGGGSGGPHMGGMGGGGMGGHHGGGYGGGGGGEGGGGRGGGRGGYEPPKPIKSWATAHLATKPA